MANRLSVSTIGIDSVQSDVSTRIADMSTETRVHCSDSLDHYLGTVSADLRVSICISVDSC